MSAYEWSEEELERFEEMVADGNSPKVISEALGIPVSVVIGKFAQRTKGKHTPKPVFKRGKAPAVHIESAQADIRVCIEQDARIFRKMLAVAKTCEAAGVALPAEVRKYFGLGIGDNRVVADKPPVLWLRVDRQSNPDETLRGYSVDLSQVNGAKELLIIVVGEVKP